MTEIENVPNPEKKVDEAWKAEIEKERTSQKSTAAQPKYESKTSAEEDKAQSENSQDESSGNVNFASFLSGLAMQAYISLGEIENPANGQKHENLEQAQYMIDVISLVQNKTKGNLTSQEENMINSLLYELRMKYVEKSES